jgi:esterase
MKETVPVRHRATTDLNGYHIIGSGSHKVMMLHGWLTDAASWSQFWEHSDQETFTWVFMDARGYGLSKGRHGSYSMQEIAQDALDVAESLGWERFSLVGHSMAGVAIQRALLTSPDRILGLIGVAAVPASGGGLVGDRRTLFDQAVEDSDARSSIINFSTGRRKSDSWVRQITERSFACSEADAVRGHLDSWADDDFHAQVVGNTTPVGLVIGEHDPSLTAERMADTWLSWYPTSCLDVLAGSGHYPMEEQPLALISTVERMLTKHRAPASHTT